jgi:hypothetical protein
MQAPRSEQELTLQPYSSCEAAQVTSLGRKVLQAQIQSAGF